MLPQCHTGPAQYLAVCNIHVYIVTLHAQYSIHVYRLTTVSSRSYFVHGARTLNGYKC